MVFSIVAEVKGSFATASIGHFEVPDNLLVVTKIYMFDYYYDSGHSHLPIGSRRPVRSKKIASYVSSSRVKTSRPVGFGCSYMTP